MQNDANFYQGKSEIYFAENRKSIFAEFWLENSKLFCFVRADKTFQFYGFVELIVHGASLLSL